MLTMGTAEAPLLVVVVVVVKLIQVFIEGIIGTGTTIRRIVIWQLKLWIVGAQHRQQSKLSLA